MNTVHTSIVISAIAALSTLAAAGLSAATEDYSSGTGVTNFYTAFAGTPAQSQITSPGAIWIGDVEGLTSELDNPFYNDVANFPNGTPVLAFGPDDLNPFVEINFSVEVSHADFVIYDIETNDAVRVLGFDDQGTEIYNSGFINGNFQFLAQFTENFDPPVRELLIEAVNQDGLMLSPINILYSEITACPADLDSSGTLDIFDVLEFIDAYNTSDPIADFTDDGNFDIFDVLEFVESFNAGCPD